MRKIGNSFYSILASVIFISCNQKDETLPSVQIKKLNYPSASAVEYYDGKLFVMGDDATKMIVLDTNLSIIDSIVLFPFAEQRIPKATKHDIESIMLLNDSAKLLLLSSGSLTPYRDTAWMLDPATKKLTSLSLTRYFEFLKTQGLGEMNIEGATSLKDGSYVYSNRGHLGWPKNHLIFAARSGFLPEHAGNAIMPVNNNPDTTVFNGISGLTYSALNDALIMTVSTEATRSVYEDGAIGKSFIWVIKNAKGIIDIREIKPDLVIDLDSLDKAFNGQKIESATVIKEAKERVWLVLVADNDNGTSTVFKLSIEMN